MLNPDGSNLRPITPIGIDAYAHIWAPDGRSIAFAASGDVSNALMAVDVTTGALRTVYTSVAFKYVRSYCWSPSSARFSLVVGEFPALYLTVNADGSGIGQEFDNGFYARCVTYRRIASNCPSPSKPASAITRAPGPLPGYRPW